MIPGSGFRSYHVACIVESIEWISYQCAESRNCHGGLIQRQQRDRNFGNRASHELAQGVANDDCI